MPNELNAVVDVQAGDAARKITVTARVYGLPWTLRRLRMAMLLFRLAIWVGGFGGVEFVATEPPKVEYDHMDGHGRTRTEGAP